MTLSWPHLGLRLDHLEISRLEISPRKLSCPYLGHILGLRLEMSKLEISPRKLFLTLSWPHLGPHFGLSTLEISPKKAS